MDRQRNKVDIISLGCSKNLIDSERLLAMLKRHGFEAHHNPHEIGSETVVVNTCGFIGDAKEESIEMILDLVAAKERGEIGKIAVMGCLSERYRKELESEIPEVDGWFGKFDWTGVVEWLNPTRKEQEAKPWERVVTTLPHNAYLKISEGCNRRCAFCAIPLITGPHRSRPMDEIEEEVKSLVAGGARELNVIAQDLSSYGLDLYHAQKLPELIDRIADIKGVDWIRLHYAYPSQFPMEIMDVMARRENVCNYLDIALQHISDNVLDGMRRHITSAQTRELLAMMREKVPGLHLRTTLMVGFPGEGEKEFQELMDFAREQKFERMGAFAYCEEEDTFAARNLKDSVPQEEKQRRLDALMALQEEISQEIQEKKIGKTLKVMIDREEDDQYVGRTEWDSPEVDPEVLIKKGEKELAPGKFYNVVIDEAMPFELIGHVAD